MNQQQAIAKRRRTTKPRIPAACAPMLVAVDAYVRRYEVRGQSLADAASDVFDGWLIREELEPLIRRRLLAIVHDGCGPYDGGIGLCGSGYTVRLTDRAQRSFWPDRVWQPLGMTAI